MTNTEKESTKSPDSHSQEPVRCHRHPGHHPHHALHGPGSVRVGTGGRRSQRSKARRIGRGRVAPQHQGHSRNGIHQSRHYLIHFSISLYTMYNVYIVRNHLEIDGQDQGVRH